MTETKKTVKMSGLDFSGRCFVDDLGIEWIRQWNKLVAKKRKEWVLKRNLTGEIEAK